MTKYISSSEKKKSKKAPIEEENKTRKNIFVKFFIGIIFVMTCTMVHSRWNIEPFLKDESVILCFFYNFNCENLYFLLILGIGHLVILFIAQRCDDCDNNCEM